MVYVCLLVIAETGDKSQLTAFTISVNYNWKCVLLGGGVAHILATVLAICTKGQASSENSVNTIEGIIYLAFAVGEIIFGVAYNP